MLLSFGFLVTGVWLSYLFESTVPMIICTVIAACSFGWYILTRNRK